jgi:hypothetical protein
MTREALDQSSCSRSSQKLARGSIVHSGSWVASCALMQSLARRCLSTYKITVGSVPAEACSVRAAPFRAELGCAPAFSRDARSWLWRSEGRRAAEVPGCWDTDKAGAASIIVSFSPEAVRHCDFLWRAVLTKQLTTRTYLLRRINHGSGGQLIRAYGAKWLNKLVFCPGRLTSLRLRPGAFAGPATIAKHIRHHQLIVVEPTICPGTPAGRRGWRLADWSRTGTTCWPVPGRGAPAIPISTGAFLRLWGDAAASLKLATALNHYVVVKIVPVPSVEAVEAVKLSEKRHPSRRVNELRVYGAVASNSESLAPRGRQIPPDGLPASPTPSPPPHRSPPTAGAIRFPWP